jgi:uncharacterized membrane protein (UPF0136 family)
MTHRDLLFLPIIGGLLGYACRQSGASLGITLIIVFAAGAVFALLRAGFWTK